MEGKTNRFPTLFKKYRLKAEFATLSALGGALAEKGLIYEDSIFSHWQKGDRLPNRPTIIKLLEIFVERKAIAALNQANEFLASAGEGYLTKQEMKKIDFKFSDHVPFQVPNQIEYFSGRETVVNKIKKITPGNILLIHGRAGVGKSALAIHLGHILQNTFSDGVLWFKLDTSDVMDILLSIAFAYGVDIGIVQDKEIRASMVRSILADKKVLLIFDNVELKNDLNLLLSNYKNCVVIITSRYANLSIPNPYINIPLETFSSQETLLLFKTILGNQYIIKNRLKILELASKVGNLPLALHIFAKELKKGIVALPNLLKAIKNDAISLKELSYGDKNLYLAINFSYELLDEKTKKLFLSLSVFDGKDFSIDSVSYINKLLLTATKKILHNLQEASLIEESTKTRYRMHPMIRKFVREKQYNPLLFLAAAKYYENFLSQYSKSLLKSYPNIKQESDNVLYIFKKCYDLHYWDQVIALWNPLETLLYATHQLNKTRYLYQIVKTQKTGINIFQKVLLVYFCFLLVFWSLLYFAGLKIGFWNNIFGFSWGLGPFIGGIIGFPISKSWGLFKSSLGKAVFFLSLGLFSWGIGSMIWVYYNFFLNNPIPYPSFADLGYLPSYFFWTIGMINLPHAIGGKFSFRKKYRIILFLIPIFVVIISYYLLVFITKSSIIFTHFTSYLKLFLDIAYPTGDVIILSTALILGISFKFLGGKYKYSIYSILLSFCFQYIADFLFSYTTTVNTYYNGAITDLFFIAGLYLITFGVLGFYKQEE